MSITMEEINEINIRAERNAFLESLPAISYEELLATVNKWMVLKDPNVVKLLLAVLIGNRLPTDAIWLFLVAQSGGGKSELMSALNSLPEIYSLSSLTPNTFVSGAQNKSKETSLLLELGTGKTIVFKDFTTVLEMNKEAQQEVFSQLREIYDGYYTKRFGTGNAVNWKGKLGFIAGCTPIIEQRFKSRGALGERFLNYSIEQPDRKLIKAQIRKNVGKEKEMREELQNAFYAYMKGVTVPSDIPELPEAVQNKIEALADLTAFGRTVVMRDSGPKKEIEYIAPPEMPTRLFKQLQATAISLYILNGNKWHEGDWKIVYKLGVDSIHSLRFNIIQELREFSTPAKTTTLATLLSYPTSTVRRYLEDLNAVKIIKRIHQGTGKSDLWELYPEMRALVDDADKILVPTKHDNNFDQEEVEIPIDDYDANNPLVAEADGWIDGMSVEEQKQAGLL